MTSVDDLEDLAWAFDSSPDAEQYRAAGVTRYQEMKAWTEYQVRVAPSRHTGIGLAAQHRSALHAAFPHEPDLSDAVSLAAWLHHTGRVDYPHNFEMVANGGICHSADLSQMAACDVEFTQHAKFAPFGANTATIGVWSVQMARTLRCLLGDAFTSNGMFRLGPVYPAVARGDSEPARDLLDRCLGSHLRHYLRPGSNRWPIPYDPAKRSALSVVWGEGGPEPRQPNFLVDPVCPTGSARRSPTWVAPHQGVHPWLIAAAAGLHQHFAPRLSRHRAYLLVLVNINAGVIPGSTRYLDLLTSADRLFALP